MLIKKTCYPGVTKVTHSCIRLALQSTVDQEHIFYKNKLKIRTVIDKDLKKKIIFSIADSEVMIIYQNDQSITRIILFIGEVLDYCGNPSKLAIEHNNAILASLEQLIGIPGIRLYRDLERELVMIGGLDQESSRGPFCKDYCNVCVINFTDEMTHGFELEFA